MNWLRVVRISKVAVQTIYVATSEYNTIGEYIQSVLRRKQVKYILIGMVKTTRLELINNRPKKCLN